MNRVGDRILERLAILVRGFFRQHDWAARYAETAVAILLTGSDARQAGDLVESLRQSVAERLVLRNHRTDQPMPSQSALP